jgi:hypothetical protein
LVEHAAISRLIFSSFSCPASRLCPPRGCTPSRDRYEPVSD